MIASLRGVLAGADPDKVVIETGGVGYGVLVPGRLASGLSRRVGDEVFLHTYLHVRDDALQLFGFESPRERRFFVTLIGVSGVGPKVALAILSAYSVSDLETAVVRGDDKRFESIPGIGRKLAQRLVIELKDKVGVELDSAPQAVVIMRDMTEMFEMQRKLIEREKLAAVGELVGSVAHELNNKLGPILGYAELMQRSAKDDKSRHRLRVIEDSALKAKSIIEALLGFSRHRKPLRSYFSLNKVLKDALSLMEFQLKKNEVKMELHLADDLPDLFADSVQVQQILVNLLKNAYEAVQTLDDKKIEIKTALEKDFMVFSVRDNGVGISEHDLTRVFDPFFTTQKASKGTGLGLSVAYGIVKEHNGDIILNSKQMVGTEVIVKLPLCSEPVAAPNTAERGRE